MRNTILVISFVAICIPALSQKKRFESGYVVSLHGDTISGMIQHKGKFSLCKGINFKADVMADSTMLLEPSDVSSFCFYDHGKCYKSLAYRNNSKELTHGFGELLFEDEIKLYKLYLESSEHNGIKYTDEVAYVIERDSIHYTLLQPRAAVVKKEDAFFYNQRFENSKLSNPVRKEYLGILYRLFMDCPHLRASISKVDFDDDELVGIIKEYLACKRECNK